MPLQILIVDNQPMVRRGLTMFLNTDADVAIVGEAGNGREAVSMAFDLRPDVILMDLMMPEMNGVEATRAIRQQQPDACIIALSSTTDYALMISAILAGVSSYVHKGTRPDELLATIKGAAAGRVILPPALLERALNDLPLPREVHALSSDELVLLRLLAFGHSDEEMAQRLDRTTDAIRLAIGQVQVRLSSSSRLLAVLRAMQLGLIERLAPS